MNRPPDDVVSGVLPSKVSLKYLKSNATSHSWIFGAVAELIDNACDPDANASQIQIDYSHLNGVPCLTFFDNGNGMTSQGLYRMLSFGYSDKPETPEGRKAIGQYGNGFKSGSMRLGHDALVLTKQEATMSVGLLSQTYLAKRRENSLDEICVPLLTMDTRTKRLNPDTPKSQEILSLIVENCPLFQTPAELVEALYNIPDWVPPDSTLRVARCTSQLLQASQASEGISKRARKLEDHNSGTFIFIWNLQKDNDGRLELDFDTKPNDIINRRAEENEPDYRRSLKIYSSILYHHPKMRIFLRGQQVKPISLDDQLKKGGSDVDVYRPKNPEREVTVSIRFGFLRDPITKIIGSCEENYGLMMYHNNRLIKAFEKTGVQRNAGASIAVATGSEDADTLAKQAQAMRREDLLKGLGVFGVVDVGDMLRPTHNKQDFHQDDMYRRFFTSFQAKLKEYCNEIANKEGPAPKDPNEVITGWDSWIKCDECFKWRRVPDGTPLEDLEDKLWYCSMNPDVNFSSCDIPQENSHDLHEPSQRRASGYQKPFKRKLLQEKRMKAETQATVEQSLKRQQADAETRAQHLETRNRMLNRQMQHQLRALNQFKATPQKRAIEQLTEGTQVTAQLVTDLQGVKRAVESYMATQYEEASEGAAGHEEQVPSTSTAGTVTYGEPSQSQNEKPSASQLLAASSTRLRCTKCNVQRDLPVGTRLPSGTPFTCSNVPGLGGCKSDAVQSGSPDAKRPRLDVKQEDVAVVPAAGQEDTDLLVLEPPLSELDRYKEEVERLRAIVRELSTVTSKMKMIKPERANVSSQTEVSLFTDAPVHAAALLEDQPEALDRAREARREAVERREELEGLMVELLHCILPNQVTVTNNNALPAVMRRVIEANRPIEHDPLTPEEDDDDEVVILSDDD